MIKSGGKPLFTTAGCRLNESSAKTLRGGGRLPPRLGLPLQRPGSSLPGAGQESPQSRDALLDAAPMVSAYRRRRCNSVAAPPLNSSRNANRASVRPGPLFEGDGVTQQILLILAAAPSTRGALIPAPR